MEGCFGDTIQGFLQLEGAREDSKLQENISPTWNDQEARVAVNQHQRTITLSMSSRVSLKQTVQGEGKENS